MLGDGKRREAVMLVVCGVLGVAVILLLALGLVSMRDSGGDAHADLQPRRSAAPAPEPPGAHGPIPVGTPGDWITTDDYPVAALHAEQQGMVAMELAIDATGAVSDCTVRQSSGVAVLDATTCRLGRTRMHFRPARDIDGTAIPAFWRRRVVWRLPS